MKRFIILFLLSLCQPGLSAQTSPKNWYERSFYLLHEDHHTRPVSEVGAAADLKETERILNLSRPEVIQIHAKGNPGWTTYPSNIGHTPPKLKRDVLSVWRRIADTEKYPFSIYFNLGRDEEIMNRRPEWNRSNPDGSEIERALCYHSGVAENYLWPMIKEVMTKYRPNGWWFDGTCFTVKPCYCDACQKRFLSQTGFKPPSKKTDPNWSAYQAMQREIYREMIRKTAELVHGLDPNCLVAFNWAYSLQMPEKPAPGIAYLTGDVGNEVERLSPEAHWYDSSGLPFDLMTQLCTHHEGPVKGGSSYRPTFGPKPPHQIQQEMAVVIANGGRFWAWDNPTPESGLIPFRHEFLAEHVAPWLAARKRWSLGSSRLPDVSLLNTSTSHYAVTDKIGPRTFLRDDEGVLGPAVLLPRLHLNYEMIGDWRLVEGKITSSVLVVENSEALTDTEVEGISDFVTKGGTLLLSGKSVLYGKGRELEKICGLEVKAVPTADDSLVARWPGQEASFQGSLYRLERTSAKELVTVQDSSGRTSALLTANPFGRGKAFYFAAPLMTTGRTDPLPLDLVRSVFQYVLPPDQRLVTTNASENVEIVLREKEGAKVLHLVNMAEGERTESEVGGKRYVEVQNLPQVPPCEVSVAMEERPENVWLQPQGDPVSDWQYRNGKVEVRVPGFQIHQMVVFEPRTGGTEPDGTR